MKQNRKRLSVLALLITGLMLVTAISPGACFAKDKSNKTVRVAYVEEPGYQEGGEGEYKTGYGYEYLQKLARLNGWKYEYVYGSFSELIDKLEKGEVDLMGKVTYTKGRSENISYGTYEEGKENFYLYVRKNNKSIDPLDYSSLNGKKIGTCMGQIQETEWKKWCKKNDVDCEIVDFAYFENCQEAMNNGKVDAIIEGAVKLNDETKDWEVVLKYFSSPFYFGVSKDRPDILKEVNSAQNQILEENPFYNEKVQERYMPAVSIADTYFNDSERKWLKAHNGKVKFGYLLGFLPLCDQGKDGECQGVAADVMAEIEEKYAGEKIEFETVPFKDYYTMFDALRAVEISAAWPAYDDYYNAENSGYTITDTIVNTPMMLVFNGEYTDKTTAIIGVINTGSLPKIYGQIHYPDSEIKEYDSYEKAIKAVLNREVGSVLYVSTTYNVDVVRNDTLKRMNMITLPDTFGISMAVAPKDIALSSILDKGIMAFGEAGVNHSLITHSAIVKRITIKDYFQQHPYIGVVVIVILVLMVAMIALLVIRRNMALRIKQSQGEKELYERISNTDELTGLYNRKMVFRKCKELLDEHPDEQFVMVHVDMKHFRLFNTFFGEETGDKLLCDVADIFREMSKDYDYWAYGRIEADVFCLFFPFRKNVYEGHLAMALKYMENYRKDFLIEPVIGLYFVTDHEMPMEMMFTRASMAAKEVKRHALSTSAVFDEALEEELNEKQQIINDMQTAVDNEEFKVYLQPKYSLRSNKLVGAEALVRWIHPVKGLISPGKFIPVFETNGFITVLDRYMWEHVCQLLVKWKKEGKPMIPVSVNVSRISMFGTETVGFLKSLVKKYDIEPKYLELELTESVYIDEPEEMKKQMQALKDAGFTILLDDFGSGYSSLNTLRELPVDVLKLDMKLISTDANDTRGGLVLASIIRMSNLLDMVVIAEGVELQQQADYLKGIGCEYAQGFLYSKPVPVEDYENMLTRSDEPVEGINQPVIGHIGKIIAEIDSGTYAMGTVIPTPLACMEFSNDNLVFLRVNPDFYTEFKYDDDNKSLSSVFRENVSEESYAKLIRACDESVRTGNNTQALITYIDDACNSADYMCSLAYEGDISATHIIVATFVNITDVTRK